MGNCITFAFLLYVRRVLKGEIGHIVIRKSHWGPFPHFLYGRKDPSGTFRLVSFVPDSPSERKIPPLFFKGKVRWGDVTPSSDVHT